MDRRYAQAAGLVMTGPAAFLTALVVLAPFTWVVLQAFVQKKTGAVGLANFQWLLGPAFVPAFVNTLVISIGSVVIEVLVAVPLALLLNQRLIGRGAMRALVTLPWAVPTIAVATAFLWLGNTNYGVINQVGPRHGHLRRADGVPGRAGRGHAHGHRGPRLEGAAARVPHRARIAPVPAQRDHRGGTGGRRREPRGVQPRDPAPHHACHRTRRGAVRGSTTSPSSTSRSCSRAAAHRGPRRPCRCCSTTRRSGRSTRAVRRPWGSSSSWPGWSRWPWSSGLSRRSR